MISRFLLFLSVVFLGIGQIWGQTTVTSNFGAQNGNIGDNNTITYFSEQTNSSYWSPLRVYADTNFGIQSNNEAIITSISITYNSNSYYNVENTYNIGESSSSTSVVPSENISGSAPTRVFTFDVDDNVKYFYFKTTAQVRLNSITVTYEIPATGDHTITVTQPTGGEITPGTTGVDEGGSASFTATAESSCYTFSHWIVDGTNAGSTNPYEFTNVTEDHTITAVFNAVAPYTITATAGANGSISPNGATSVNCGADQIFTITPNSGYAVAEVLVNGVSVGAVSSYEFTNVTENQTISASFVEYTGPCVSEDFENIPTNNAGSYLTRTWIGNDGIEWTVNDARTDQTITGKAIGLRSSTLTTTSPVAGGVGTLSFDYKRIFSGNSILKVFVNGTQYGGDISVTSEDPANFSVDVNIEGDVTIELINSGGNRIAVDNLNWTCSDAAPADTHFRSQANGDWTSTATWESSEDGLSWADATTYPGATAESVVIQAGHTVNINSSAVTITNTNAYGTLEVTTPDAYSVSGEQNGVELFIKDGGVFLVNSPGEFAVPVGNAFGLVETGGKIIAGPNMGSGTSFVDAYVGYWNGLFYFGDAAICEWANSTTTLGSSSPDDYDFFFPYEEDDMPIFKVTVTPGHVFGNNSYDNVFHSVLEIIEPATFSVRLGSTASPQKTKTFVGGVRGSGKLIMESNSGPVIIGNSEVVPELGGTATIVTNITDDRLRFPNGANVTAGSVFTIENSENTQNIAFERQEDFNIHGTLDITNMRITNTAPGGVFVKDGGTLRTRHTGGLFGDSSAIVNATNFTMETGSTIDYYADEPQAISSGKEYYHLIFSGNGTKNPQNATNVNTNGSIYITGNPIVDYTNHNLGSTAGNSTAFTMDGGKLIIGTGGTQPRPGGIYNITGGAIEFTGNSITSIKVSPEYHDVIISGQNITPGGKGFTIKNVLSVTPSGDINIPSTPDTETPYVVTAQKGVQVEEGGQLTFENNANLMQDPGAANSGKISMLRKANVPSNQYNYWASPVSGQNLYEIYNVPNNRVMTYNTGTDYFTIKPNPHQSEFGIGYSIKGPVTNEPQTPSGGIEVVANFIGTPRNESLTISENRIPLSDVGNHYNLIGNPFPSNLDLIALYNDSDNNTKFFDDGTEDTPTVYFWDNISNTQMTQQGSNYNQSNYALLNLSSGIGTAAPCNSATCSGVGSGKKPNGIVKPGQGFIIRAAEGADHLTLKNDMRTTVIKRNSDDDEAVYFKTGNLSAEHNGERPRNDKFWVELVTADDLHIQAAVGYFTQAENSFERFDSKVMNEDASDNIYTLSEDDVKLSIQGRKGNFSNEDIIPLGVRFFKYGIHKIQLEETKGIFKEHQDIYVKDKYLNITHNLSANGPYLIDAQAGEFNDRFEIVFKPSLSSTVNPASPLNSLKIEKRDHQIEISSSVEKITEVEIFNLSGWSVYKAEQVNENILKIPASQFGKEIIIVNVQTESGKTETKKIINK